MIIFMICMSFKRHVNPYVSNLYKYTQNSGLPPFPFMVSTKKDSCKTMTNWAHGVDKLDSGFAG